MDAQYVRRKKSIEWHESPLVNHLSGARQAEFPFSLPSWGSSDKDQTYIWILGPQTLKPCPHLVYYQPGESTKVVECIWGAQRTNGFLLRTSKQMVAPDSPQISCCICIPRAWHKGRGLHCRQGPENEALRIGASTQAVAEEMGGGVRNKHC